VAPFPESTSVYAAKMRFVLKNCRKFFKVNFQTSTHPGRLHVALDQSMVRVYVDQDNYELPTLKGFNVYPKTKFVKRLTESCRDTIGPLPLPLFSEFIDPAAYPLYLTHGHVDFKNNTIALIAEPKKGERITFEAKAGQYKEWNAAEVECWREAGWLEDDEEDEEEADDSSIDDEDSGEQERRLSKGF